MCITIYGGYYHYVSNAVDRIQHGCIEYASYETTGCHMT